jgi:hypothetical protein
MLPKHQNPAATVIKNLIMKNTEVYIKKIRETRDIEDKSQQIVRP